MSTAGVSPSHTNHPPIGPRTSSSSPDLDDVVQEARHLAVGEPLDRELELGRAVGRRRDRVRPRGGVAVGCREPHDVVLAGPMVRSARAARGGRSWRWRSRRGRETTRAVFHGLAPVAAVMRSVALVALLEPRVAAIVVAVALPEAGFVVVEQLQTGDPLGALPEVEVRDQQTGRAAVFGRRAGRRRPPTRPTPCRP